MTEHTIHVDAGTQAFFKGAADAGELRKKLEAEPGQDYESLNRAFWLYLGLNMDREMPEDDAVLFLQGAATNAPRQDGAFTLTINTSGATFHGEDEEDMGPANHEVARLLRHVAQDVLTSEAGLIDKIRLLDINGNTCGSYEFH
jgi:hypothetical protein